MILYAIMTTLLARPPIEAQAAPKKPYAWYARALKEGFGIAIPLPQGDQDTLDRVVGLFESFLGRRFGRQLHLAVYAQEGASKEDVDHAREMLALFPHQTLLVVNGEEWFEVNEADLKNASRVKELQLAVSQAQEKGHKVSIAYHTPSAVSEESFAQTVDLILSWTPDFFVTNRPRHARAVIGDTGPKKRLFWDSKVMWYLRGRVGRFRFLLRVVPLYAVIYMFEALTGKIITLHTRPLYAKDYSMVADTLIDSPRCAIMMQGPFMHKRDYTLETIIMYRKEFPDVQIVLSTWEDEDAEAVMKARLAGAEVVLSKPPSYGGPGNTNMQLTSARAGLLRAQAMGAEFILKQRSDQRIYNHRAMETMSNMLKHFPPSARSGQKARLLFGNGSDTFQPYQEGEVVFGAAQDIVDYYSAPLIPKGAEFEMYLVEMYIPTEFLKKKGWTLDWTLEQGWDVYRECFMAFDWSLLDLYWYKYYQFRNWEYQNQRKYVKTIPTHEIVRFGEWFNIFVGGKNKKLRPDQRLHFPIVPRTEDLD